MPRDSISVLETLPGKLDIKRRSPSQSLYIIIRQPFIVTVLYGLHAYCNMSHVECGTREHHTWESFCLCINI